MIYNGYVIDYVRESKLQNNLIDIYHMWLPNAVYAGEFTAVAGNLNRGSEWALYVQRLFFMLAQMNLGLAIFNLIPVPPLDGYRFLDMFVFKGKLAMDQRTMYFIQIGFLIVCMTGVLSGLLTTVNGAVYGFFSNIMGALV